MRKFLFYILLMLLTHQSFSQLQLNLAKKHKSDTVLVTKALTYGPDSNIYIAGILQNSLSHAWLKKLDDSGHVKLSVYFSQYKHVIPSSIAITPKNEIVITGYNQPETYGQMYIWVAKFSPKGKLLWERVFSKFGNSFAVKAIALPDNSLILAANMDKKFTNQFDWLVLKLDSLGFIKWWHNYGTPDDDKVNDMSLLPNGDLALAGYYRINKGKRKIAVTSVIDTAGNVLFTRFFKFFALSEATVVTSTQDTGIAVSGFFKNKFGRNNLFIEKLSVFGDSLWAAVLPMAYQSVPFSLLQTSDKSLFLAFTLWSGKFPYTNLGVAKFDYNGKLKFLRLLNRGSDALIGQLIESQDSNIYLLTSMYLIDFGWSLGLISCSSPHNTDLQFIAPVKKFSTDIRDSIFFKACLKGYEMPQKIIIYRNSKAIDTITTLKIALQNDCQFYFEKFLPLKFGYNFFTFQVINFKGKAFKRSRIILRLPFPKFR